MNVLANDYDPDDTSPLALTLPAGQNATIDGSAVVVPLIENQQTILYRITDADGASTIGIVHVPGKENHPPVLSADGKNKDLRTIKAGETAPLSIKLADIVEDPDKDPDIRLTSTEVVVLGGQGEVTRSPDGGLVFKPPANLQTPVTSTIQLEVTDRPNKTDAERQDPLCRCLATLAVDVLVQASSPPRIVSPGAVSVPQALEPVTYDLAPLAVDDQGDPLTFALLGGSFGGLTVTQSGSTITLESRQGGDALLPVGTAIPIRFSVTDGKFPAVEGSVNVTIIATNRGRPAPASFADVQAKRDTGTALPNLLDKAINPFAKDAKPLTLVGPLVDNGAQLTCDAAGNCQFLSTTVGTFHVTYTVKDFVNQTAPGSLTVVVKGPPRAPGVPSVQSVGDHVVSLTWTPADMQGGTFKTYHVTTVEDGRSIDFTATGGQFTGLTNGTTYHFIVRAENEIGPGEPSLASSPAIPDRVPDPPVGAASTDYGDGTLMLKWSPPPTAGDFTAIQKYEVAIGGQTISVDGATTVATATALQNGTPYTFKVRAQNKASTNNGWGDWSSLSTSEIPSRFPDPPTGVVASSVGDGGTPRLTVKWNAPAFDGGRPVNQYKVCQVENATNCQTITSGLQATFNLPRNQSSSFTAIAFNTDKHANQSQPSAASAAVTTVGNPDPPTIGGVTSGNHALVVAASSTNGSGCSSFSIEYSLNGGTTWQASATFNGLTNGTSYSAVARTTLPASCGTSGVAYHSADSNVVAQTPYGPLVQPSMNSGLNGNVITWSWSTNRADDGRLDWTANVSGECPNGPFPAGTFSRDYGFSSGPRTCTIVVSGGGQSLQASSAQQTPAPPTPPVITVSRGGTGANGNGTTPCSGCHWVNLHLRNFSASTTYFVSSNIGGAGSHNVTTDGAGTFDVGDGYWFCGSGTFTYSAGGYTSPPYACP